MHVDNILLALQPLKDLYNRLTNRQCPIIEKINIMIQSTNSLATYSIHRLYQFMQLTIFIDWRLVDQCGVKFIGY